MSEINASTYVRQTVERLAEECRKPGQDRTVWELVHLLGIITTLDVRGYGAAVCAAADEAARGYGLPAQSVVDAPAEAS